MTDTRIPNTDPATLSAEALAKETASLESLLSAARERFAALKVEEALRKRPELKVGDRVAVPGRKAESFTLTAAVYVYGHGSATAGHVAAKVTPHYKNGNDGLPLQVALRDVVEMPQA